VGKRKGTFSPGKDFGVGGSAGCKKGGLNRFRGKISFLRGTDSAGDKLICYPSSLGEVLRERLNQKIGKEEKSKKITGEQRQPAQKGGSEGTPDWALNVERKQASPGEITQPPWGRGREGSDPSINKNNPLKQKRDPYCSY